jgi:hypothetical protein
MSLIDIESAKKVVETISQIPTTALTTATLTPKILPTQKQPFEFPLRSTSSFPYILGEKMEKENSHQAYDEIMYQINAVQFNAGCSSSSTDLDKLIEFYNNHSDEDTMAQWMNIYEEQKLANSIATNSRAGNNNNNHHHYGGETNLGRFKNRDISDSVDDLLHQSPTKRIPKAIDALNKEAPFNRSMDLPITGADKDGFFALEKCQSVDFHTTKFDLPSARLLRSKELANIADIDDDTEY